jgi:hypothetical protein
MFIREQFHPRELRTDAPDFTDMHVWSPISCRHTLWTYAPLVRCDQRGCIVPGSRQRNPFPPYSLKV